MINKIYLNMSNILFYDKFYNVRLIQPAVHLDYSTFVLFLLAFVDDHDLPVHLLILKMLKILIRQLNKNNAYCNLPCVFFDSVYYNKK